MNPLAQGFYTVPEAARLIRVGSSRRIYSWLRGYPKRNVGPLLERDFQPIEGSEELSFLDLMEVRFVEHFREQGVKVSSLRIAADALRREWKTSHPFAQHRVVLVADKADVFVKEVMKESADQAGDPRLRSLITRNYAMYETIKQSLLPGVEFDPETELARAWRPIPGKFPQVVVDPYRAFGQPVMEVNGVPTSTLKDAWIAEGKDADAVAYWFNISARDVVEAVSFEGALDNQERQEAA